MCRELRKLKRHYWDLRTRELYYINKENFDYASVINKEMQELKHEIDNFNGFEVVIC